LHQYISSADAQTEATDLYNRAQKYDPLFYVNDAEELTTHAGNSYSAATKAFATKLQSLTTKPVYLYSYKSFYLNNINSQSGYDGKWIAAYQSTSITYQLWQNTDSYYSTSIHKAIDASKFVTSDNWFGNTVDTSKYPNGGYKVGDKVRIKSGITYYGMSAKADDSLAKVNLTVKATKAVYTGTSSQVLTVYNGSKVIGQVRAQDVTKVGTAATKPATSETGSANWVKESKTYTLTTPVKLRAGASTSSSVITTLKAGETIKTDQAIIQNGYRWVRQPRGNGYAYIATGPASASLAYVKSGASHTYYTVKSGDSWWVIAQRNGMSMTMLASQNGKNIYSMIHPGDSLLIK